MGNGQSSMATHEFADKKSCETAGRILLEEVNKKTPVFKSKISYKRIKVRGLR